ncbi:MAG: LysR family transcriptional regulator [Ectothiorhodospiraceae bacterium]|nr:LysR family transcriptional regulator [Ectothiorhodospiraceae bacterium]
MNFRHLTYRLMQVYVAVIRTGSVSQAARQLHLTQPTVSQQLRRLQDAVGEPLVEMRQGGVVPTEAGRELYRACQDVIGRFDDFRDHLSALRGGERGRFSIALVSTAQYVLPRLLGPFSQAHPQVEVDVHIGNRQQMLARFERQDDDIYVFSHPPSLEHALAARFMRNPLVIVGPSGHPAAHATAPVSIASLLGERFLLRESGSATRMLFDGWLQERGLSLGATMHIASNEAIRVGVASGLGLALLSEHVLPKGYPGLVKLPVEGLPIQSHWQFIISRERRLPHAALSFLRFAEQNLEDCVEPEWLHNDVGGLLGQILSDEAGN